MCIIVPLYANYYIKNDLNSFVNIYNSKYQIWIYKYYI